MKTSEVNEALVGRKVSGICQGFKVTGTVVAIVENKYTIGVCIKLDVPMVVWSGDYSTGSWVEEEYESTARKSDGWGNLHHTELVPANAN